MSLGVPWVLIAIYAIFKLVEYGAIKRLQMDPLEAPRAGRTWMPLLLGPLVFAARIFGWGLLVYFAIHAGIVSAIVLLALAFPLSLFLQLAPQIVFKVDFGIFVVVLSLLSPVVLPLCAVVMIALTP